MPTSVSLPALGESVTEGTVTRWLKQVGDTVAVDEPLLEVSTDKVDTEIPSPVAGTLLEIKAAEDETVEVGAELAVIGDAGESTGLPTPRRCPGGPGRRGSGSAPPRRLRRSRTRPAAGPRPAAAGSGAQQAPGRRQPRAAPAATAPGAGVPGSAAAPAAGAGSFRHLGNPARARARASPRAPSPAGSSR